MSYADHNGSIGQRSDAQSVSEKSVKRGGPGNDTLTGTNGDTLYGEGGDDTFLLAGNPSNSSYVTAYGGSGRDVFQSSGPVDSFALKLYGDGGGDTFSFNMVDNPSMAGGRGDDAFNIRYLDTGTLTGDEGNDTFDIRIFIGTVDCGSGDDVVSVGAAKGGSIFGGTGRDKIHVGGGSVDIYGDSGDDDLSLGYDLDRSGRLDGGTGNDTLASTGHNVMLGGDGRDVLESAASGNTMTGGAGADRFVYGDLVSPGAASTDTITDFSLQNRDVLDLSPLMERLGVTSDPFKAGYLSFDVVNGSTNVLIDSDGGGNSYRTLTVLQNAVLTQSDKRNYKV